MKKILEQMVLQVNSTNIFKKELMPILKIFKNLEKKEHSD